MKRCDFFLFAFAALAFCPICVSAAPVISPEYEITDSSKNHTTGDGPNPATSNMVRIGDDLFFVYRCGPGSLTSAYLPFVRRFSLVTHAFDPAVRVDMLAETGGFHREPSIYRDGLGRLHVQMPYALMQQLCVLTNTMPPRSRIISQLGNSSTWSSPAGMTTRFFNTFGQNHCNIPAEISACGADYIDTMGVYDPVSGVTHMVGEGSGLTPLDGSWNDGFSRAYYRILPEGQDDGPYIIVQADSHQPPFYPPGGNIFSKGALELGREPSGPHSLHLVWTIHNTWTDGNGSHWWNYNLYYAKSSDGGNTWQPANASKSVTLASHIIWTDSAFLAYSGDVDTGSDRSFGIDSQSRPFLVVSKLHPGTGAWYGMHVDLNASPAPQYDLIWTRWNGQQWVSGNIDSANDYHYAYPRVRVDLDDNVYVFLGEPVRYIVSSNGGATWSPAVSFGQQEGSAWRLYSYGDPLDPNFHYIAYQNRNTHRVFLTELRLTSHLAPPTVFPSTGTYYGSVSVTMSQPTTNAQIRYTLDGSTPTVQSSLYNASIILTTNKTVKAGVFRTGWPDSPITTAVYTLRKGLIGP